jgi:hypothetical protein
MKDHVVANLIAISIIISHIYFSNYVQVVCTSEPFTKNDKYQCNTLKE